MAVLPKSDGADRQARMHIMDVERTAPAAVDAARQMATLRLRTGSDLEQVVDHVACYLQCQGVAQSDMVSADLVGFVADLPERIMGIGGQAVNSRDWGFRWGRWPAPQGDQALTQVILYPGSALTLHWRHKKWGVLSRGPNIAAALGPHADASSLSTPGDPS